jgi:hypothetical protein
VSRLILVTLEPAQRIAAEPDTLERFKQLLREGLPTGVERPPAVPVSAPGSVFGWPLEADANLPPGIVYLCPHLTTARADGLDHPSSTDQVLGRLPAPVQQSLRVLLAAEAAKGLEQP